VNEANAAQVGGTHYKGTTYQHWDFVIIALMGRYLEGNITKYVSRWRKKNGLQDLQKARHYLDKLIEQYNIGNVTPLGDEAKVGQLPTALRAPHFCDVNGIDEVERMFIILISEWRVREHLHRAGTMLDALIERQQYAEEDQRTGSEPGPAYTDQG
jgi:hypothetical protein